MSDRRVSPIIVGLFSALMCLSLSPHAQSDGAIYQLVISTYTLNPEASALRIVTTDNAPVREITAPGDAEWFYTSPSFSPSGEQVVYSALSRSTNAQLYLFGANGDSTLLIDDPGSTYEQPVFSPDGSKIAFVAASAGQSEADLYVADADGSSILRLTSTPDIGEYSPAWSPDGQSLAYLTAEFPDVRILTIASTGGEPRPIYASEIPPTSVAWSPNGHILFSAQTEDETGSVIYTISADGTGEVLPVFDPTASDSGASIDKLNLSSDGETLAYQSTEVVLNADGGLTQRASIHVLSIATGEDITLPLDLGDAFVTGFDWR